MVSIHDVAKRAGVAKSTVSKVLNNYEQVSEETKQKVLKAVKELNYVPNTVAVSLSKKAFDRVGLFIDLNQYRQPIDEINMQYIFGAFHKAKEYNLDIITLFSSQFEDMDLLDINQYLKSQRITCLIIFCLNQNNHAMHEIIMSKEYKCVVVDAPYVNEKTSSVSIDHYFAQYDVAKRTIENEINHSILYLAGDSDGFISRSRLKAMYQLQKDIGFNMIVEYANFSEKYAREFTFKHAKDVNIIICASDLMAIGVVNALREMDLYRPVSGFDGISLMGYSGYQMNTVKQDFYGFATIAFDELYRLISGKKGRHITPEYKILQINYLDVIS